MLQRLAAPLLDPIRRWLPTPGGLDLSPLVALVLIQILSIVLGYLQDGVLRSLVVG